MPKLSAVTPEALITVLEGRGFVQVRSRGSHRIFIHRELRRRVVVPFHHKDIPKGTLREILRDAGLSPKELRDLL